MEIVTIIHKNIEIRLLVRCLSVYYANLKIARGKQ